MATSAFLLSAVYAIMLGWRLSPAGPGFAGSESYSDIARDLISQGQFTTTFRPPLYPLFIAVCMKLFGAHWEAGAMLLQGVAAVGVGLMIVAIASKLFGSSKAALVALVIYLANILFQFEVMAKRETILFTLLALGFFSAPLFIGRLGPRYLLMSVTAALAFLLRPNALAMLPVIAMFVYMDRKQSQFAPKLLVLPIIAFCLVVAPWQIFVYKQGGVLPITSSTNSGQTLWKGNNQYLLDVWPKADIDLIEGEMTRGIGGRNIKLESADRELKAQAVQFIKENIGTTIKNGLIKAGVFFSPLPVPWVNAEIVVENGRAELTKVRKRSLPILAAAALQSVLVWIGWIGFLCACRSSREHFTFAVGSVCLTAGLLAIHTLTYPESRYRWPLDVFLGVLSADYIYTRISRFFGRSA